MTPNLWEKVYHQATRWADDKDDPSVTVAEGRVGNRIYRIVYLVVDNEEDEGEPTESIYPITGFPIGRHGLPRGAP